MLPISNNIQLKDRTLWIDGDSSYDATEIERALMLGYTHCFVNEITPMIEQYNKFVPKEDQIFVKSNIKELLFDWNIPSEYKALNVIACVVEKLSKELSLHEWNTNSNNVKKRERRVAEELALYKKHGLFDVLRVIIFVINTLNANNVVWGVGRGSSVSSYVLYLIQVHDVDSVEYNLDINDFLH